MERAQSFVDVEPVSKKEVFDFVRKEVLPADDVRPLELLHRHGRVPWALGDMDEYGGKCLSHHAADGNCVKILQWLRAEEVREAALPEKPQHSILNAFGTWSYDVPYDPDKPHTATPRMMLVDNLKSAAASGDDGRMAPCLEGCLALWGDPFEGAVENDWTLAYYVMEMGSLELAELFCARFDVSYERCNTVHPGMDRSPLWSFVDTAGQQNKVVLLQCAKEKMKFTDWRRTVAPYAHTGGGTRSLLYGPTHASSIKELRDAPDGSGLDTLKFYMEMGLQDLFFDDSRKEKEPTIGSPCNLLLTNAAMVDWVEPYHYAKALGYTGWFVVEGYCEYAARSLWHKGHMGILQFFVDEFGQQTVLEWFTDRNRSRTLREELTRMMQHYSEESKSCAEALLS